MAPQTDDVCDGKLARTRAAHAAAGRGRNDKQLKERGANKEQLKGRGANNGQLHAAAGRGWNTSNSFKDVHLKNAKSRSPDLARERVPDRKREFKLPWREAGLPNHHDDKEDSGQ